LKILWLKFGPNVSRSFFMPQLMWFSMYPAQTLPPPPWPGDVQLGSKIKTF
jgi:hypothetical protein